MWVWMFVFSCKHSFCLVAAGIGSINHRPGPNRIYLGYNLWKKALVPIVIPEIVVVWDHPVEVLVHEAELWPLTEAEAEAERNVY